MKKLKEQLQKEYDTCGFWDMQTWNGEGMTDMYSLEEQIALKTKQKELKKQLEYLDMGIILQ